MSSSNERKSFVINGRLCEVVCWHRSASTVEVRDVITGEAKIYDWYTADIVDPTDAPEALLIAMSKIAGSVPPRTDGVAAHDAMGAVT